MNLTNYPQTNGKPTRRGVTVIEVLFATGIAIFGLVGIASLISVAGRQASDANQSTEGQAAGQVAYNDFVTRGYNNTSRWRWFNDQLAPANRWVVFNNSAAPPRATSVGGQRTANRHALCIDPLFFADPDTAVTIQQSFPDSQAYRPGLFPYFQDNYNPVDPSSPLSANRARLLRISLSNLPAGSVMSAKTLDRLFQIGDDLAITMDEEDKTLPTERVFSFLPTATPTLAQSLSTGEYSWFATLCPREPTALELSGGMMTATPETFYTLSIVVCKRRDRSFTSSIAPAGERVVAVTPTTLFFRGGSGGRVVLSAAGETSSMPVDDTLGVGDWVMLSKEQPLGGLGFGTICRWYRVIALDNEVDDTTPPVGSVWTRNVILDGPDWTFDTPTQATLVNGVVSVLERVIPVE